MILRFALASLVLAAPSLSAQTSCWSAVENTSSRLATLLHEIPDGSDGWTTSSITTYTYDDRGRRSEALSNYPIYEYTYATTYTYDAQDRLVYDEGQDSRFDAPRTNYHRYSEDGTTREQRFNWRLPEGGWDELIDRRLETRDGACNTVSFSSEVRDSPADDWRSATRTEYDYEGGLLMETRNYGDSFGMMPDAPVSRRRYAYDAGVRTSYTYDVWDETAGSYIERTIYDYTYRSEDGEVDQVLSRGPDGAVTGRWTYSYEANPVSAAAPTSPGLSASLRLAGANPTAGRPRVAVDLERARTVDVAAFDVLGRRVATLHVGTIGPGRQVLEVDEPLPAGRYVIRLAAEDVREAVGVTVVR